ncbi:alpha/beta fold hydrolase [Streptomyces sp. NBC_01754]|uniref:thioesterase II family protein n=1 Tax=Streptomyces sp. NBC_01754 TaxID=2975930 RepID=UPI002DDB49A7|nr:alpha/beta fold hydrolase [Streptomyces sp. NBC_01754]WSC95526.1 alpha/beta fold hydrolase [Streptomyces sp. NBC_01754]
MTRYLSLTSTDRTTGTRLRMLCFPYAGGGASAYGRWQRGLDVHGAGVDVLPVQLPGREGRIAEPRFTDLGDLVADLDAQLDDELHLPHVLYGHSMGALIAYSLVMRRQLRGATLPSALVLSAYRAPHLPAPQIADPDAGDEELLESLASLGGIPRALLSHPEFLSALLPVARDDLMMCTTGTAGVDSEPVRVPLHLFAARRDRLVSVPEVVAWRRHAGRGCEVRTMPGGHFFIRAHEDTFLHELSCLLRPYAPAPVPAGVA